MKTSAAGDVGACMLALAALALSGCSVLFPMDDYEFAAIAADVDAAPPDARIHDAGAGDAGELVDVDAGQGDAGALELGPLELVARPYTDGVVCNELGALERGGALAGLGRSSSSTVDELDGQDVSACLEARFALGPARAVVVVARAAAEACGAACSLCETGRELDVFVDGRFVRTNVLAGELVEERIPLGVALERVTVCRTGQGPARDQVEVDFIGIER